MRDHELLRSRSVRECSSVAGFSTVVCAADRATAAPLSARLRLNGFACHVHKYRDTGAMQEERGIKRGANIEVVVALSTNLRS